MTDIYDKEAMGDAVGVLNTPDVSERSDKLPAK